MNETTAARDPRGRPAAGTAAAGAAPATGGRRPSERRLRSRAATIQEIKDAARAILSEEGVGALTLSAVARRLQIVPSALYRYMANREELLGALSVDAYAELADTVEAAVATDQDAHTDPAIDPVDRLRLAARAWRTWALQRPTDFALVFGPSIPGHVPTGPAADRITEAADRTGAVFARLLVEALAGLDPAPDAEPDVVAARGAPARPLPRPALDAALATAEPDPATASLFLSGWIRLQGHLCAEVFDNIPPLPPDARDELFERTVDLLLAEAGLTPADADGATAR